MSKPKQSNCGLGKFELHKAHSDSTRFLQCNLNIFQFCKTFQKEGMPWYSTGAHSVDPNCLFTTGKIEELIVFKLKGLRTVDVHSNEMFGNEMLITEVEALPYLDVEINCRLTVYWLLPDWF